MWEGDSAVRRSHISASAIACTTGTIGRGAWAIHQCVGLVCLALILLVRPAVFLHDLSRDVSIRTGKVSGTTILARGGKKKSTAEKGAYTRAAVDADQLIGDLRVLEVEKRVPAAGQVAGSRHALLWGPRVPEHARKACPTRRLQRCLTRERTAATTTRGETDRSYRRPGPASGAAAPADCSAEYRPGPPLCSWKPEGAS